MNDPVGWENLCLAATPQGVEVVGFKVDSLKKYEGKRLPEIGRAWGEDWADALIDLTLLEKNGLRQVIFVASDSNVAMQVRQPWMKFGTDAEAFDPATAKMATHPRAYGTYPRILGPLRARAAHPHARGRGSEDDVGAWPSGCRFAIAAWCARG